MAEDAAARLVEHEIAQAVVAGDEAALRPERVARRRRDAADDHVADLSFGMGRDDVNRLDAAHRVVLLSRASRQARQGAAGQRGFDAILQRAEPDRAARQARPVMGVFAGIRQHHLRPLGKDRPRDRAPAEIGQDLDAARCEPRQRAVGAGGRDRVAPGRDDHRHTVRALPPVQRFGKVRHSLSEA